MDSQLDSGIRDVWAARDSWWLETFNVSVSWCSRSNSFAAGWSKVGLPAPSTLGPVHWGQTALSSWLTLHEWVVDKQFDFDGELVRKSARAQFFSDVWCAETLSHETKLGYISSSLSQSLIFVSIFTFAHRFCLQDVCLISVVHIPKTPGSTRKRKGFSETWNYFDLARNLFWTT